MYTVTNYKTKKALKEAVSSGEEVRVFQPGLSQYAQGEGKVYLEGPHYPEPHRWYAEALVKNGVIRKVW